MNDSTQKAAQAIAMHNVQLRMLLLRMIDPEDLGHAVTHEVRRLISQALNKPRSGI